MATAQKFSIRETLRVVDASKEIVLDVMFLTTDLMHSIRNNLPIDMTSAQVTLQGARIAPAETVVVEVLPVSRRRRAWGALVLAAVFVAATALGGLYTVEEMRANEVDTALAQAHRLVASSTSFDTDTLDIRLEAARSLLSAGQPSRAASLLEPHLDSRRRDEVIAVLAPAWLATDRLDDVRSLIAKSGVNSVRPATLTDSFNQSWELDPRFSTVPTEITVPNMEPVGDGVYSVQLEGQTVRLDVPTPARPDDWQDGIAAYRLCTILNCKIEVPRSELVRFEIDGVQTVGALSAVRLDGVEFPIERVRGWRHLLQGDSATTSAAAALKKWRKLPEFQLVSTELQDTNSQQLAAQLSSMLVLDFLTNNYGRFGSSKQHWGHHVRVAKGRLYSPIQPRAFATRSSKRVQGRFMWAEKLPAGEVAAALAVDVERLGGRLFPVETPKRADKLHALAEQQAALALRAQSLEEDLGFSAAFPF